MKKSILFPFLFLTSISFGQSLNFDWHVNFGGSSNETGSYITALSNGDSYSTGYFIGSMIIGSNTFPSFGLEDIYIQKIAANGNLIWVKTFGGSSSDYAYSTCSDKLNNIIVTGIFNTTVDFDPGPLSFNHTSNGSGDIYIQKMDSNGDFLWAKQMGGSQPDGGYSITTDTNGNIYSTGYFRDTVDFDPGTSVSFLRTNGFADIYIQKLDPNGNLVWAKNIGGSSYDYGNSIKTDDTGNVYITGTFRNTVDFDPGPGIFNLTSNGIYDIFVLKLDVNGDFVWAKTIGGSQNDNANEISIDPFGNILIAGTFQGTIDIDPGVNINNVVAAGSDDAFVLKLSPAGNFIWAKHYGSNVFESAIGITTDYEGHVYVAGVFNDDLDFNPGGSPVILSTGGVGNGFLVHLDSAGNYLEVKQNIGDIGVTNKSVAVNQNKQVYIIGSFTGTMDVNPEPAVETISSNGVNDIFIQKFVQCMGSTFSTITMSSCNTYLSPSGQLFTQSGNFNDTISNSLGCDSIITINLTINDSNDSISVSGDTLIAASLTGNYQWLDCNNNFSSVVGETNQMFIPNSNGNYALQIIDNGCTDTSACQTITVITTEVLENTYYDMMLYPNPTNHHLYIKNVNKTLSFSILSVDGKLILKDILNSNSINIESLTSGMYVILLNYDEGNTVKYKFIKN